MIKGAHRIIDDRKPHRIMKTITQSEKRRVNDGSTYFGGGVLPFSIGFSSFLVIFEFFFFVRTRYIDHLMTDGGIHRLTVNVLSDMRDTGRRMTSHPCCLIFFSRQIFYPIFIWMTYVSNPTTRFLRNAEEENSKHFTTFLFFGIDFFFQHSTLEPTACMLDGISTHPE